MQSNDEYIMFNLLCSKSIRNEALSDKETKEVHEITTKIGLSRVMELSIKAKLQPFIANLMIELDIDTATWTPVLKHFHERNRLIIDELANVYAMFSQFGVKKVFVTENFGSMLMSGSEIGLFASGDVDNYADISEYNKISAAFAQLGYSQTDRYSGKLLISSHFINDDRLPDGFEIGVDWFPLSRLTLPCPIDADRFVDWNCVENYGGTAIKIPPAAALMYICLLHISLHSFSRAPGIRLYRDIVNLSARISQEDWNKIKNWSYRDRVCSRVFVASHISNIIGRVEIPRIILELGNKQNTRLINHVFDHNLEVLKPEPSRLSIFYIEILCNDYGLIQGMREILIPDSSWMKQVYGSSGIGGKVSHIIEVL